MKDIIDWRKVRMYYYHISSTFILLMEPWSMVTISDSNLTLLFTKCNSFIWKSFNAVHLLFLQEDYYRTYTDEKVRKWTESLFFPFYGIYICITSFVPNNYNSGYIDNTTAVQNDLRITSKTSLRLKPSWN